MVKNGALATDRLLDKPLLVFGALISLIPLPVSKFFTGSLLSFFLLLIIRQDFRSALSVKLARRFLWCSLGASGIAILLIYFQIGSFREFDLASHEIVLFPVSLAISVFALVKISQGIGIPLTILLAAGPLLVVDLIQRAYLGNVWKYSVGVTVTFLVLYLLRNYSKVIWLSLFITLCLVSLIFDTRSLFLLLSLAVVISLLLQKLASKSAIWKNLAALVVAVSTYLLFFSLAVQGWLGKSIMRLTLEQSGGDSMVLLFGARPESQGNINLIASNPLRISPGEPLSSDQISLVRDSFAFTNRDPNSTYVNKSIIGFEEFHSIFTDLWFHLGAVGLAYGILISTIAIRMVAVANKNKTNDLMIRFEVEKVVLTYSALRILWDLCFSPLSDMRVWPLYVLAFLPLAKMVKA